MSLQRPNSKSTAATVRRALVVACVLSVAATCGPPFMRATAPTATARDDAPPLIDFSHAGYGGGGVPLPEVAAVVTVRPGGGDDTALLQAALDHVASLPPRADGFRGAVHLAAGRFMVAGGLRVRVGGVVLRGSSGGGRRTTVVATGTGRRTLIEVGGDGAPASAKAVRVTDKTVPAGGRTLTLESVEGLAAGDRVVVRRPSTAEWIAAL